MGRSILSILAGVLVWGLLWAASNGVLVASLPDLFRDDGTTDNAAILLCVLAVSVVCSVLAGYLTASLAPGRRWRHVVILAVIQLAIGVGVQLPYWTSLPLWYNLVFLALVVPGHLAGGKLRLRSGPRLAAAT